MTGSGFSLYALMSYVPSPPDGVQRPEKLRVLTTEGSREICTVHVTDTGYEVEVARGVKIRHAE